MIAKPLSELLKKEKLFEWDKPAKSSFLLLKEELQKAPVLAYPDNKKPMIIYPDACGYGIGAVLSQQVEEEERNIAYASRVLSKSEMNYSITEKECLALVWAVKKFRTIIWGAPIKVVTDHQALCWLMKKRDLAGRLARFSLTLQEYDITISYRSGKHHDNADCLSRYPVEETNEASESEEEEMWNVITEEKNGAAIKEEQERAKQFKAIRLKIEKERKQEKVIS